MKIRHGVCSDCGAQYKIPVSFSANRAKCKQCGGVVEIGPPTDEPDAGAPAKKAEAKAAAPAKAPKKAAPPMPAKKVRPAAEKPAPAKQQAKKAAPKKASKAPAKSPAKPPTKATAKPAAKPAAKKAAPAKPVQKAAPKKQAPKQPAPAAKSPKTGVDEALVEIRGSGKKKGGMSMKERLLAERAAAAKAQAAPAAAKKPAPKKAAPARAATAAAGAARAGSRAAAPAARKSSSRSGARAGQRRGGRRGEVDEDEEIAGASRRSGGGRRGRQKQSKVPMLVGLGLMAAAGVGGFLYMQNQKSVKAADEEVANQDPAEVTSEGTNDSAATDLIDEAAGNAMIGDDANSAGAAPETPVDPAAQENAPEESTPAATPEGDNEKPAMEKPKPAKDPSEIDLTVYDFERAEGTTDEEWADILADVETAIDLDAGAAGTRALNRLRERGRKAFPAVLNAMHDLDYTTQDGIDNGDVLQKCLREILAGLSFNWFYTTETDDVWKNKKAVQRWSNEWSKVVDDPAYWDKISAKATRKAKERESDPDPLGEELEADLDDLDDLEDM